MLPCPVSIAYYRYLDFLKNSPSMFSKKYKKAQIQILFIENQNAGRGDSMADARRRSKGH